MPDNVTSGICPFCGASMVFEGKSSHLIRPEALLPFKVTQQQAFDDFRKWINSLWFAPEDLKQYARSEGKLAGHFTRDQKRQRVDALAAAAILQDWLDAQPRE